MKEGSDKVCEVCKKKVDKVYEWVECDGDWLWMLKSEFDKEGVCKKCAREFLGLEN